MHTRSHFRHHSCFTLLAAGLLVSAAFAGSRRGEAPSTEEQERLRDRLLGLPTSGRTDFNNDGVTDAADFVLFVPGESVTISAPPVSFWVQSDLGELQPTEKDVLSTSVSFWFQNDGSGLVLDSDNVVQLGSPSFDRQ